MPQLPDDAVFLLMFAVPDDAPDAWTLSHDDVEHVLLTADPEARIDRRRNQFSYEATLPFGWTEGSVTSSGKLISIDRATIDTGAEFAVWLRTHLLPNSTPIAFNSHEGVEVGYPAGPLPDTTDTSAIRLVLSAHLETVEDMYNS